MLNEQEQPKEQDLENFAGSNTNLEKHIEKTGSDSRNEGTPSDEDAVVDNGEITNNDGSIIETLDTVFHDKPGMIKDYSIAGSNRTDYYEAASDGESDSEEELDVLRKQQPGNKENG